MIGASSRIDDYEVLVRIVEQARDCAYSETKLDLRACLHRPENVKFMREHAFRLQDVREILSRLRVEEYCLTSCETGKPDAYVFNPCPYGVDVYLKMHVEDDVVVISFHEPDRPLYFPYRRAAK